MSTKAKEKVTQTKKQIKYSATLEGFREYAEQFNIFSERENEVKALMYAVLMKEHVLFKGLPGTAKSQMAKMFLNNIKGSNVFKLQFNAFMDDTYVFGPQLLEEFKKGKTVHNIKNSLVDADFAFLDEFFEANEQVLTSCNEVLNERTFTRNEQQVNAKLVTAIMTTNREREKEKRLEAVYDRVLFKSRVLKVASEENRLEMYKNAMSGKLETFNPYNFSDLQKLYNIIDKAQVSFSVGILNCYSLFQKEFEAQSNIHLTDRKIIKGLTLLKIVALLEDRDTIQLDDFQVLKTIFCVANEAKEETVFDAVFVKVRQEFGRIEKESKLLENIQRNFKSIGRDMKNAVGYKDYKEVKATAFHWF